MTKPICVVKVDMDADFGNGQQANIRMLQETVEGRLPDYHVFVVPLRIPYNSEPIQFEVFYEKDFTEIKYEELKKIITDSINQLQTT